MRRCLGGLLKQGKSLLNTREAGQFAQRTSALSHPTAAFTAEISGTQTLLTEEVLSKFAKSSRFRITPLDLHLRCNASGGAGKSFPQKNKSQRGVSSSGKQLSGTDDLLSSIEKDGEGFKEADVVSVWQQLAEAAEIMSQDDRESQIHKAKGFQTLVDMSIMATKRFSTEQLAKIVMNAGQLGFDDDMLLDRISQNFMTRMSQVDAAELVNLATGLSLADHSPSVILFDAIQKRAVELASKFSSEQKAALEKAFKSFDYDHKDISSEL